MPLPIAQELKPLFEPESIAVIGASNTPGKWGYSMVTRPIQSGYRGRIFPVNPKEKEIYGLKAYPNILDVPEPVDMAIITVPALLVTQTMKECVKKGVKVSIVITAGFAETGDEGSVFRTRWLGSPPAEGSGSWVPTAWACGIPRCA